MKAALASFLFAAAACAAPITTPVSNHPQRGLILKNLQLLVDDTAKEKENHFFVRHLADTDWIFWREGRRLLSTTFEPFAGDKEMSADDAWGLRIRYCREQIDLDTAVVAQSEERPTNRVTRAFASDIVYECVLNGELVVVTKMPKRSN